MEIVDLFEVIDIEHQHAERVAVNDQCLDRLVKRSVPEQSGERVASGPFLCLGVAKCLLEGEGAQAHEMHERLMSLTHRRWRAQHLDRSKSPASHL